MLTVSDILFALLGFGFGVGCTIRVGQLLGAQRPAQAKLAGHCHLLLHSFLCRLDAKAFVTPHLSVHQSCTGPPAKTYFPVSRGIAQGIVCYVHPTPCHPYCMQTPLAQSPLPDPASPLCWVFRRPALPSIRPVLEGGAFSPVWCLVSEDV